MLFLDMLRRVMGRVPGCPEGEAADVMRDACMEFCTKTRALLTDTTVACTGTLGAAGQFTEQVLDILEASIASVPVLVTHINDPRLAELGPGRYALTFNDPSVAKLTPTPPASVSLRVLRVIAPGPDAAGVDDVLWLRHSEALVSGCLARLLAQPGVAWANPALSSYHLTRFNDAMTAAAADNGRNREQPGRRLRVKPA